MSVFNVADLTASMRLDTSQFDRGVATTKGSLRTLADSARSAGSALGSTLMSGLTAASTATNVLLAATGALAIKVVKTGIEYNILQQNSRAALTTLLGSAEAANVQMDKLDDFARNSPFAKDIFIKAQQQLLAFGMEAEKVIPTMDAVQQAIAASGGSSADLAGVVEVLAKIQSSGKITAEDLNQLGGRGIDAATLMGKAFGKTGAEMRTDISDGALGAEEAIAALTEQMQIRFGGATDNVKKQMTGALDRVKGATRDIGSLLARPFVDPKGGGMAVDWTNQFADGLRSLELVLGPVAATLMDRMSPAFVAISTGLESANSAIKGFQLGTFNSHLARAGELAPGILGLSAGFLALSSNLPIVGTALATLGISINPLVVGMLAAAAASPEFRDAIVGVLQAAQPLLPALQNLAGAVAQGVTTAFAAAAPMVELLIEPVESLSLVAADVIGVLADVIVGVSELPPPLLAAGTAAIIMGTQLKSILEFGGNVFGPIIDSVGDFRDAVQEQMDIMGPMRGALGDLGPAGDRGAGGLDRLGAAGRVAGNGLRAGVVAGAKGLLTMLGGPWGIALMAGAAVLGYFAGQNAEAKQHVDALTESLDAQSGEATVATIKTIADAMAADTTNILEWADGLKTVGETARLMGTDLTSLAEIVTGSQGAYDEYLAKLRQFPEDFHDSEMSIEQWAAMMNISVEDAKSLDDSVLHTTKTLDKQRQAFLDSGNAVDEMSGAQQEADTKARDFAAALEKVSDASSTTAQKVTALNDALAIMNGKTPTADEALRLLNDSTRSLAKDMVDAEGNVIMFGDSIDAATGKINTKTEAGSSLAASLSDFVEKSKGAAVALEEEGAGAAAVQASLEGARSEWVNMAVQSGISAETAALAWDRMAQGNPGEITTIITADTTGVDDKIVYANGMLDTIAARSAVAQIWADDTVFGQKMAGALGDLDGINAAIATATVNMDPTQAEAKRVEILEKLTALAATDPTVKAMMDPADLNREILAANVKIRQLSQEKPTPKVLAEISDLQNKVATATALINGIQDKTVTVTTNLVENRMPGTGGSALREASGGIVKAFANGGFHGRELTPMSAIAQMVPANTWRVVGDNITSPEMYVPMDGSARSREILREGVDMMGFALVPKNTAQGLGVGLASGAITTTREGLPAVGLQAGQGSQGKIGGDTFNLEFHGVKTDDKEELAAFLVESIKHSRRGGVYSEA